MDRRPLSALWAAAAIFLGLCSCTHGAGTAASLSHVIAASGTTVVDRVIPSLLANATQALAPTQGNLTLTFESVDSPTDIGNFLSGADDYAITYVGVDSQQYQQANRSLLQIPWAIANTAVVYNLPGTPEDSLHLTPKLLAGIYSCSITSWQDPAIAALNPTLTLPNLRIIPASYSESKGTTLVFSRYVALEPSWTLGYGVQLAWPRCVQHVRTPDGMTSAIARAPGAIGWAADWRVNATSPAQLYTAHLQNMAGNFIPSNSTYSVDSLPVPPITSANWINVTFATSELADIYPMGNFISNIIGQDVSDLGPDQASADKALMGCFVSDAVQQALPFWTLMPLPRVLAVAARQAVDSMIIRPLNTSRGGASAAPTSSTGVAGGDDLVSGATVVEGSGGASIQNLVKSVLANATATGRFGNSGLTFASTDSYQGKQGVISQSFAYAMSTLPLTAAELAQAKRPMVQVPLGYSPIAVIHSIPNVGNNVLQLNPLVLAGIFQCQVTTWNDVSIAALNPNLTLPNQPILPLGLSDVSGTTSLFAAYLLRAPGWKLGMGTSLAWPRCVRRTIGGSNAMATSVNATAYSIGYAALGSLKSMPGQVAVASIENRANLFISPYNCPFPFHFDELPPTISSPNWGNLDFNATAIHSDRYTIGGLIYIITDQDLSLLGYPQSIIMQQLTLYWLSDAVQSNMSAWGASPMLPQYLHLARQQVAMLNTQANAPSAAPAPGVTAAGSASSGPSQQQSSKAAFPWWAGLIIALVAVGLMGALLGLACFARVYRRRAKRGATLEEAVDKDHGLAATDGAPGSPGLDGQLGSPQEAGSPDGLAPAYSPGMSLRQDGGYRPSADSDCLVAMNEHPDRLDDARMPLDLPGAVDRSEPGSFSTQRAESLKDSSGNNLRIADRRRSSSYGRDTWGTDASKGSWGMQSRGQSLNNEAAFLNLPDILKSRAESVDLEDIERGSLLGRGSFGKVYQGWWRGGMVAIKVVPHEGDLGEKVEVVRESLLSSSIQHPQIVTTYKAVTVGHGAHQHMSREETIPEGATVTSRSSNRNLGTGSGRGSGSSNTNRSSGPRDDLMETWIIMEYCDLGSLDSAISDGRFSDLEHLLLRLLDVAMGMDYLHKLGILHTDLKPSNVLLKTAPKQANDPTGCTCKLADFGLSRVMETNATHITTNTIGTIAYQPEEVLKEGKVTPASDVYSFAILMYELYTCKHLFKGMLHSQMFFKVFNGYRPPIPEDMPRGLQNLMQACWSHNPAERPSFRFITRTLQKLIIEQRRATSSGRQISMNLDDALAGAEMAQQFPVGPSMPIRQPSDPPSNSASNAPNDPQQQQPSSSSSGSQHQTPRSSGKRPSHLNEFELALLDFRRKVQAGQLPSPQKPEQQDQQQQAQSNGGGEAKQATERQGLAGDGPDTPPKLNSTGSPPPEQSSAAHASDGAATPGMPGPSRQASVPDGQALTGRAFGSLIPDRSASGSLVPSRAASANLGPGSGAPGSPVLSGAQPSPFATYSISPMRGSADSESQPFHHVRIPPKTSKKKRYDLLLGD